MSNSTSLLFKAVGLSLLGYACIAVTTASTKALPANVPVVYPVFFSFLIPFLFTIPQLIRGDIKDNLRSENMGLIFFRALTGLGATAGLLYAVRHIPLVDGVLLQNTSPLFVPLILLFWMKKNIPFRLWIVIFVGFLGVLLILKPSVATLANPAALIALGAGILTAITLVLMEKLKKTETTNRILFYYFMCGIIVTAPLMIAHATAINLKSFLLLISAGIFMYLAQFFVTHSFAYGKARVLAPLSYTAVVFSGILGWIIWGHIPDWLSFIGIAFVILGGIASIVLEKQDQVAEAGFTSQDKI